MGKRHSINSGIVHSRKHFKKYATGITVGIFAAATLAVPAFAAPILNNVSFENGTDPGSFTTVHPGNTNITDWSVVSGDVDYIGTYWQASDGSRSISMNGDTAGAIRQTVPTAKGGKYTVTFYLSGNPAGGPSLKTLKVDAGSTPTPFTYDTSVMGNTLTDMKWMPETFSFTATGASTSLTFTSLTDGFYGPALDNVLMGQLLPKTTGQCMNNGWKIFGVFKNQRDCLSFIASRGKLT